MECDRCHRPVCADRMTWQAHRQTERTAVGHYCGCIADDGATHDASLDCAAARDVWQVAEIARLTAEVERLRKPRWDRGPFNGPAMLLVGSEILAVVCRPYYQCVRWRLRGDREDRKAVNHTEPEVKAAAEKACGVEVKDGV